MSVAISSEERPQWVLCLSVSTADSMKPYQLKRHLETKHSEIIKKLEECFRKNLMKFASNKRVLLILLLCHPYQV
jgi:uncharacterized protein (DUF302 family)